MQTKNITQEDIDTVRILSADAVQKANSGHPGTPMALAPIGHVLWSEVMHYNPKNPEWVNRDRLILSCGHACMLQYCFLYLTGYELTMDDLKHFRQLHSITAGHPEYGLMPGIEVTTGPLGQGFANGVGFAIAQKYMAERYNRPDFDIFDYKIYAICSDGDLMEGVSAEAASLAGHLGLGNIIYLYDDNHITIEGDTDLAFNEDVAKRFEAYGWHVQSIPDGNDLEAISDAIKKAQEETQRPSLIKVRTHMGYGSPNKHDSAAAHGSPLGEDEVRLVKENFGFDPDKNFVVPDEVLDFYRKAGEKGAQKESDWNELYKNYKERHPDLAKEYEGIRDGKLPDGWEKKLPVFEPGDKMATRKASGKTLNAIAEYLPQLIGGSADLAPSTDTNLNDYPSFSAKHHDGRNFHFGIREHAMGAVLNGMALSKFLIPYGALTSNPSIFEKAISGSADYDDDIAKLAKKEVDDAAIFFSLAIEDIQRAADIFKPVYDKTDGKDGFVSLEVSPHLARDTEGAIEQARELWKRVDRKNVMIKIPGTKEGLPAIRKCLSEGININVTLLFGLPRYRKITEAFMGGLEDRLKADKPIKHLASVASFFLSRIDVMVDPILDKKDAEKIRGEIAIASAKKAYQIYLEMIASDRFKKLESEGAKPQRVLWASTSTKDPSYSDVKYAEALIGKDTINTLPMETIDAFRDHGKAEDTLVKGIDRADQILDMLKEVGVDIDKITQKLEEEGIEKFSTAYDKLLESIDDQKQNKS